MPLNCPKHFLEYNRCLDCRYQGENDVCRANLPAVEKLSNILTIEERVAILEDREKPFEPEWTRNQWDTIQQMRANTLFIDKKINTHLANTKKRKDIKYNEYNI